MKTLSDIAEEVRDSLATILPFGASLTAQGTVLELRLGNDVARFELDLAEYGAGAAAARDPEALIDSVRAALSNVQDMISRDSAEVWPRSGEGSFALASAECDGRILTYGYRTQSNWAVQFVTVV
jgi:hypothetical protein